MKGKKKEMFYLVMHNITNTRYCLCAPYRRQDSTYQSLYYTRCGTVAGMRNSQLSPPLSYVPHLNECLLMFDKIPSYNY